MPTTYNPTLDTYTFTSRDEIERIYSRTGTTLRLDDLNEEDESDMMIELVNAATETVSSFTLKYYNPDKIYLSPWVRRRATIIACYYLSMRRANGNQFAHEYKLVMEELERFLSDKPPIIPGRDGLPVPVRTSMIPTASAYIVDDRLRTRKLRVSKDYTTKTYPGQYQYTQPLARDYL